MICHRIEHHIESNHKFSNSQFGFRRGRSNHDNVLTLWTASHLARREGKYTVCLFLDIKSAFENVNVDILMSKYRDLGIDEHTCGIIHGLLRFKDLIVQRDGKSYHRRSFNGTPRGSVISPISFNVYINELFEGLEVENLGYEDALAIFYFDFFLESAISMIQEAVTNGEPRIVTFGHEI